jgi:hypothetical protein
MFVSSARLASALLETLFNDTGERLVDVFLAGDWAATIILSGLAAIIVAGAERREEA